MKVYNPDKSNEYIDIKPSLEENKKMVIDKYNKAAEEIKKEYKNIIDKKG